MNLSDFMSWHQIFPWDLIFHHTKKNKPHIIFDLLGNKKNQSNKVICNFLIE